MRKSVWISIIISLNAYHPGRHCKRNIVNVETYNGETKIPSLNFKSQFAYKVESGEKRQTIRAYRKDGRDPKPRQKLYLYTGMRTKKCCKLKEVLCKATYAVIIDKETMYIDSMPLADFEKKEVAIADGFNNFEELRDFFAITHRLPFYGILIKW